MSTDAVSHSSREDWPFRVAELARALEDELAKPERLIDVADKIVAIARDRGCEAVVGASHLGNQLAGAVVARAANGICFLSPSDPGGKVLVIDGILATGTHIVRAVHSARHVGVQAAVAVVVLGNHQAIELCEGEIGGEVVALETF